MKTSHNSQNLMFSNSSQMEAKIVDLQQSKKNSEIQITLRGEHFLMQHALYLCVFPFEL